MHYTKTWIPVPAAPSSICETSKKWSLSWLFSLQVLEAFGKAEKQLKPSPESAFTDVYRDMPESLQKQMRAMKQHLTQYKDQYPMDIYQKFEE